MKGRERLYPFTDVELIQELRFRGVLKSSRQTVHVPNGLEVWEQYRTGWLVVDEIFVEEPTDAS